MDDHRRDDAFPADALMEGTREREADAISGSARSGKAAAARFASLSFGGGMAARSTRRRRSANEILVS